MSYPNAKILTTAEELEKAAPPPRVLDVRPADAYARGHAPNAVRVDAEAWGMKSHQPGALENAALWGELIGSLGIDADTPAVVYDETVTPTAARVWWLLRYAGVRDVKLLNGGFKAWQSAGGEPSRAQPAARARRFQPQFQKRLLADREFVRAALAKDAVCLVDARSSAEYTGERAQGPRGGRIPGARHADWTEFVDANGRIKPPHELAEILRQARVATDHTAVTYCQSGGRAALDAFVLELMGARDVKNYYRSWSEWGSDAKLPIETGK